MQFITVPGYTNSGPQHWQTLLEQKYPQIIRVQQQDWECPARQAWIDGITATLAPLTGEVMLIGHSCGAVAITQWAAHSSAMNNAGLNIKGALLVAPADVDAPDALEAIRVQRPLSLAPLPFPSMLVASDNDEHLSLTRANQLATAWGSELIIIRGGGHLHSAAGYGEWPLCEVLINQLSGNQLQPV
ncbi:RBBP9/YdeN family alpha/beta hydrolase [Chimaeribacter californicus]|nr:alpha/beta hydrolase [Chimaeribacter californicus]